MRLIPGTPWRLLLPAVLISSVLLVAGCGTAGAGWTYAPLGPTAAPSPSGGPTEGPSGEPSSSPGVALETVTNQDQPITFVPATLEAPPATVVQVTYTNDSTLEHNIEFFEGSDSSAPLLGETEQVIGPDAVESVTFTTPEEPGAYYFWCVVHGDSMSGTLNVGP
jgi:plastocyanin